MAEQDADERIQKVQWIYEAECEQYREDLFQVVAAEQEGTLIEENFVDVLAHCALCQNCQSLREELRYMLDVEAVEGLVEAEEEFAFTNTTRVVAEAGDELDWTIQQGVNWWLQRTADGYQLLLKLSHILGGGQPGLITRNDIADGLAPIALGDMIIDAIAVEPYQDAEIKVLVFDEPGLPTLVNIQIEVALPSRWPDFSGIVLTLERPNKPVRHQTTGQSGIVRFQDVTRAELAETRITVDLSRE